MTSIHLIGQAHEDRQRIAASVRSHRIDALLPDHREAVLAAERYLDQESAYGKAAEQRLKRWRSRAQGIYMSYPWVKGANR